MPLIGATAQTQGRLTSSIDCPARFGYARSVTLDPGPFDEDVERLLVDPEFAAELEERRLRAERGEAVVFDDDEVRRRLRASGVPLLDPTPEE